MTISGSVRLAAAIYQPGFAIDGFMSRLAERLRAEHVRLAGAVQENTPGEASVCSAMSLIDLTSRGRVRISQDLGPQAQGCRLDARGLAEVCALIERTPAQDVELVLLNRFGKAEAEGGGLRSAFVRAIDAGIPVLTAVRANYADAWSQFHGRLASDLPPDFDAALAWCRASVRRIRAARQTVLSPAD
jgi:hypothetical protein